MPSRALRAQCRPGPSAIFFFQAEDGIRALYVTGVQTCALPIYVGALACRLLGLRDVLVDVAGGHDQVDPRLAGRIAELPDQAVALLAAGVDAPDPARHLPPAGGGRPGGVAALGEAEPHGTGRGLLGER